MPMVYQQNNHSQNHNTSGIIGIIGLGVVALGLFAVFYTVAFIGLSIFTAVTSLAVQQLSKLFLPFQSQQW